MTRFSRRRRHAVVENIDVKDFIHVRSVLNPADYVLTYIVFDVDGNNFRLLVIVQYRFKKAFVHRVMTHREYDD